MRYQRRTNLGAGIPGQPSIATTDITIRNTRQPFRAGEVVRYSCGDNHGEALVLRDGEITLPYITLRSGLDYVQLELTR